MTPFSHSNDSHAATRMKNAQAIQLDETRPLSFPAFREAVISACTKEEARLAALWALRQTGELYALLAHDAQGELSLLQTSLPRDSFPSLTPELPSAQAFEREIFEDTGLLPEGHPWLKPLRRHVDLMPPGSEAPAHDFFAVTGPEIHEVAVGPVHAGVIEPGHFRFQCAGETVLHLEIQLGYQQRGVVPLLTHPQAGKRLVAAESIAGDTTIGHATAHCQAIEALAHMKAPARAQALRAVYLEIERLCNHAGDLGMLCNDVGYLPGASWFGRLRGEFLNLFVLLCGNRFGRGLLAPGGLRRDVSDAQLAEFMRRLGPITQDFLHLVDVMFASSGVITRFENTGALSREQAVTLGLVGPTARACGLEIDIRRDHPAGFFKEARPPVAGAHTGDVHARALLRAREGRHSLDFIAAQMAALPEGPIHQEPPGLRPDEFAVSLVEGWRGEIVHLLTTDARGTLGACKVVDPSFHNWFGLAQALRGQPISDFPLCNKSFNLSYAGHDL